MSTVPLSKTHKLSFLRMQYKANWSAKSSSVCRNRKTVCGVRNRCLAWKQCGGIATPIRLRRQLNKLARPTSNSSLRTPNLKSGCLASSLLRCRLFGDMPCNLALISPRGQRLSLPKRVLAVVTDSVDDLSMVAAARGLALAYEGQFTVAVAEDE